MRSSSGVTAFTFSGLSLSNLVSKFLDCCNKSRISDLRTFNVVPRTSDLEQTWKHLNRETKTNQKLETTLKGFAFIDWQEKLGRAGFKTGVKSKELIQLLTNGIVSPQDKLFLYTKYV